MKKKNLLLFVSSLLCLTACSTTHVTSSSENPTSSGNSEVSETPSEPSTPDVPSEPSTPDVPSSPSTPEEPPQEPDVKYHEITEALFTPEKKVEITIDFSNQAAYKFAQYGPANSPFEKKEMYHPANVIIEIDDEVVFDDIEVGLRMRGNTSRIEGFCDEDGDLSGDFCNLKMSFNETFDDEEDNDYYIREWENKDSRKERKNRRLGDLKKLDLKWNKNYDNTFTKDSYAKYIYEQEGIVCQKANLADVTIKTDVDEINTLFTIFEPMDSTLIERKYAEDASAGNLYKGSWGCTLTKNSISGNKVGIEDASNTPVYDLKTNDDEPDHTLLTNLVNVLSDKSPAAEFKSKIDAVVNVDQVLKYMALAWVVGNPDDMRNNKNNTYFYFNSYDNKLEILPYDDDRCFGILQDWPVDMKSLPDYSTRMQGMSYNNGGNKVWQESPLFWRLILSSTDKSSLSDEYPVIQEYQDRYLQLCAEYASKYLNVETFDAFTERFVLAPSTDSSVGGANNQSFKDYAETKIQYCTNLNK